MNTVTFYHLPISICTPACVNLYNSLLNEYYHLPISICTSTCANLYNTLVNQYCHLTKSIYIYIHYRSTCANLYNSLVNYYCHLPKQQHCCKSFFPHVTFCVANLSLLDFGNACILQKINTLCQQKHTNTKDTNEYIHSRFERFH